MKTFTEIKSELKKYGLIFTTFIASSFGLSANATGHNSEQNIKRETTEHAITKSKEENVDSILLKISNHKRDTLQNLQSNTCPPPQDFAKKDSLITDTIATDSITTDSVVTDSLKISPIATDTLKADTVPTDSLALIQYRTDKFNQSTENIVKFLSLFENIKCRAYYDNVAKCYSIGLGFCYHKDGRKIKAGDRIRNEKELFDLWDHYAQKHYLPQMLKYFKLENMTEEEKIAITSLMFNCGPAVVGSYNSYKPSAFTKAFNQWKETGDEKYLNMACAYLRSKNKSQGKTIIALDKRRRIEEELLRGNILINEEQANLHNKVYLDLNSIVVGAFYSIGKLPLDNELLIKKASEVNGATYTDTLRIAFPVTPVTNQKKSGR